MNENKQKEILKHLDDISQQITKLKTNLLKDIRKIGRLTHIK